MGASEWWYRCGYREDVAAALFELQATVFEAGDYYRIWDEFPEHRGTFAGELRMMARITADDLGTEGGHDEALIAGLEGTDPPASIAQARVWAADSGTHSILDILKVSDVDELGAVSPLGAEAAERIFGTTTPSVAEVEARRKDLAVLAISRWTGRYLVAHEDGRPAAIFFFGCSGD